MRALDAPEERADQPGRATAIIAKEPLGFSARPRRPTYSAELA
ncbi:MAG: hypothetical protein ACRDID_21360 [Ktedonobacterales bacterium]